MLLKSVQLTLMMGPIIPVPVPSSVLEALASVEVKIIDVGDSGFQLVFSIDKQSPLQILFLLTGGMPLLIHAVHPDRYGERASERPDRWRDYQ